MRRGCDPAVFEYVVNELANERQLAEKYRDHPLSGNYIGFRECHLAPDWLLIYVTVSYTHLTLPTSCKV